MLEVNDAVLHYGAAEALRGVSLHADAGKITCVLGRNGVKATVLRKLHEDGTAGSTVVEKIHERDVQLIINTPHGLSSGVNARTDGYEIRTAAVAEGIPCITTVQGLAAAVQGIEAEIAGSLGVRSLQSWATEVSR